MLKKLTSPKAKAARSSGAKQAADKELGGLAAIPDDGAPKDKDDGGSAAKAASESTSSAGGAAASRKATPSLENAKSKKRDELSLDMSALAQAAASGENAQEAEDHTSIGNALVDRRKTLVRSPRVKNILNDPDVAGGDGGKEAKLTPQGKKEVKLKSSAKQAAAKESLPASPAKDDKKSKKPTKNEGLHGLKALKFSKTKKEAGDSSDDKQVPASDLAGAEAKPGPSTSKDSESKTRKKQKDKSESKSREEHDEQTPEREKNRGNPQPRSDGDQKIKSSLSPLRHRKPALETDGHQVDADRSKGQLLGHRLKLRGLPPANQPEVHIIGEITSVEGFGCGGFACKWGVEYGSLWHHIAGDQLGQTQIDYPASSSHPIVWSHPVDLHFATTSFQGWPKLLLQVWQIDTHMKANVVGYGFVNFPFSSGEHRLSVSLWRPMGSAKEEMEAKLLGRTLELASEDVVFNSAWADRCRLQTIATGKVNLQVGVILRNFQVSDMEM